MSENQNEGSNQVDDILGDALEALDKEKPNSTDVQPMSSAPQDIVMILVGKWAMPTAVILVLITCMSGYFLDVEAFTPVVGMIAPVVMALIMVIRDASVGKDEDDTFKDKEREREERVKTLEMEKEVKLAQMEFDEKRHQQEAEEKARQFDINTASTREFVNLAREMNHQLTEMMKKETELVVGDTKIKVADGGTKVAQKIPEKEVN